MKLENVLTKTMLEEFGKGFILSNSTLEQVQEDITKHISQVRVNMEKPDTIESIDADILEGIEIKTASSLFMYNYLIDIVDQYNDKVKINKDLTISQMPYEIIDLYELLSCNADNAQVLNDLIGNFEISKDLESIIEKEFLIYVFENLYYKLSREHSLDVLDIVSPMASVGVVYNQLMCLEELEEKDILSHMDKNSQYQLISNYAEDVDFTIIDDAITDVYHEKEYQNNN